MFHHLFGRLLGVVDEHIQADHRVVAALQAFQVGGTELQAGRIEALLAGPAAGLVHHRLGQVAGVDLAGPQGRQGQAEAANTAAGIAETALGQVALLLQPGQHLVHRFLVADADIALNLVDVFAVAVDAIPAIKAGAIEIGLHHGLLAVLG